MAKKLTLTRTEAESLVDLLEDCSPVEVGTWRHNLAHEIRELFGMVDLAREKQYASKRLG